MAENALRRAIDNISGLDNDGHYNELRTKREALLNALSKDQNVKTSEYIKTSYDINKADEIIETLGNKEVTILSNPSFPSSGNKVVRIKDLKQGDLRVGGKRRKTYRQAKKHRTK